MKLQHQRRTRSSLLLVKKQSITQTDIESSCCKSLHENGLEIELKHNKKKPIQKKLKRKTKPIVFHQRICRLRIQGTNKTARIYMFNESDMGWKKKFTNKLCPQLIDNDIESDSEMVENEVDKCRRNLMEAINERQNSTQNNNQ